MFSSIEQYKIRKKAWNNAIDYCGGEKQLAKLLGVHRTTVNRWSNYPEQNFPYNIGLLLEQITRIPVAKLKPYETKVNNYLQHRNIDHNFILQDLLINKIVILDVKYLPYPQPDRKIIVDSEFNLISGLIELQELTKTNTQQTNVIILDLKKLLQKLSVIDQINYQFTVMEKIAIGVHANRLLGSRQGQRNDLKSKKLCEQPNYEKLLSLRSPGSQVVGKTDEFIAKFLGLGSQRNYHRFKKVYFNGCQELITALEQRIIYITDAANIAKLPKDQQQELLLITKEKKHV
jgi:DNA-binding transcriptional regulator YdaS (Cro superfamily)